ncbi:MAG: hypothetical protein NTX07_04355 [Solirubrobacterales bacterium]|nr:hypothetical protein [Solirubrobacterales bacterium]
MRPWVLGLDPTGGLAGFGLSSIAACLALADHLGAVVIRLLAFYFSSVVSLPTTPCLSSAHEHHNGDNLGRSQVFGLL